MGLEIPRDTVDGRSCTTLHPYSNSGPLGGARFHPSTVVPERWKIKCEEERRVPAFGLKHLGVYAWAPNLCKLPFLKEYVRFVCLANHYRPHDTSRTPRRP